MKAAVSHGEPLPLALVRLQSGVRALGGLCEITWEAGKDGVSITLLHPYIVLERADRGAFVVPISSVVHFEMLDVTEAAPPDGQKRKRGRPRKEPITE